MEQPEITIRELRSGRFVACLPGAERIGPTMDSHAKAEAQVEKYLAGPAPVETPPHEITLAGAGLRGPADANEEGGLPAGYTVEKKRGWFVLLDPNGKKVGKSKRTPEVAAAQAPTE